MTKKIRFGVFETNSSSTHTLTIVSKEEFDAWKNGEKWCRYDELYTMPEIQKKFDDCEGEEWRPDSIENYMTEESFQTYDEWVEDEDLETFKQKYTTKSGDEIVAFGKFGYEG